ncbi:collagen-like protein, partial [bacterium]|nr:collagen-like protein [bacterium]
QGASGATGTQGASGASGPQGTAGVNGATGPQGATGTGIINSNWSIVAATGATGALYFKFNGVDVIKVESNGAITSVNNITAYGTT